MRLERNTTSRTARAIGAFAAAAIALTTTSPAWAADKYVLEEVEETPVEFGTGWYIRGDIGLSVSGTERKGQIIDAKGEEFGSTEDVGTGLLVGGAAGYRFAPKLRGDLSFAYFSNENSNRVRLVDRENCAGQVNQTRTVGFEVTPATPAIPGIPATPAYVDPVTGIYIPGTPGVPGTPGTPETRDPIRETGWFDTFIDNCSEHDEIEHDAQLFQANAYYDLHSYGRFTPFLGAGLGVARIHYSRNTDIVCIPESDAYRCVNKEDPFIRPGAEGNEFGTLAAGEPFRRAVVRNDGTSYHLAGSIRAGVSYQLSRNAHIDASYSYTHILDKPLLDATDGLDGANIDGNLHTFKVGLRYEIW